MDDERRIALVETKTCNDGATITNPTSSPRYQLGIHLDSAGLELDVNREIISYEEYHPFGTNAYQAVRADVDVSPKRYRYTGKEKDEESGFTYHGAWYLALWLGRWISVDPKVYDMRPGDASDLQMMNTYSYTLNSPVNYLDPDGKTIRIGLNSSRVRISYTKAVQLGSQHNIAKYLASRASWSGTNANTIVNWLRQAFLPYLSGSPVTATNTIGRAD